MILAPTQTKYNSLGKNTYQFRAWLFTICFTFDEAPKTYSVLPLWFQFAMIILSNFLCWMFHHLLLQWVIFLNCRSSLSLQGVSVFQGQYHTCILCTIIFTLGLGWWTVMSSHFYPKLSVTNLYNHSQSFNWSLFLFSFQNNLSLPLGKPNNQFESPNEPIH